LYGFSFYPGQLCFRAIQHSNFWWLVLAALLVGWCCLNPDESINLYGIIPIRLRYLAAGVCVIIFFSMGFGNPIFRVDGDCAVVASRCCGLNEGWAYTVETGRLPVQMPRVPRGPKLRLVDQKKPQRPRDDRFTIRDLNPLEWLARRKRRKQFEKLINDD
jgi:hypothetical protein